MHAAFTAAGRPHPRHYVSDGGVLWDWTPLLAVEWEGTEPVFPTTGEASISPSAIGGGFISLKSRFSIHVTRDSPWPDEVGTPPQDAKLRTSAGILYADAKLVIDTLLAKLGDRSLLGTCGKVDFIRQVPTGPDGGVVGSVTTIEVYQ